MADVPEQVFIDAVSAVAELDSWYRNEAALKALLVYDQFRAAVALAYRAGQAATPDGPRRWALPDEPGPEVTAVRDRLGRTWKRVRGLPLWGSPETGSVLPFVDLLDHYGPLTDATSAADGQEGRDG